MCLVVLLIHFQRIRAVVIVTQIQVPSFLIQEPNLIVFVANVFKSVDMITKNLILLGGCINSSPAGKRRIPNGAEQMFDTDSKTRKGYYFISDNDAHFTTGLILGAGSILLCIALIFLVFTIKVCNNYIFNNYIFMWLFYIHFTYWTGAQPIKPLWNKVQ